MPPTRLFSYAHAGTLIAMTEGGVHVSESTVNAVSVESAYCGSCGRQLQSLQLQSQPVYQPSSRPRRSDQTFEVSRAPRPTTFLSSGSVKDVLVEEVAEPRVFETEDQFAGSTSE